MPLNTTTCFGPAKHQNINSECLRQCTLVFVPSFSFHTFCVIVNNLCKVICLLIESHPGCVFIKDRIKRQIVLNKWSGFICTGLGLCQKSDEISSCFWRQKTSAAPARVCAFGIKISWVKIEGQLSKWTNISSAWNSSDEGCQVWLWVRS